MNTTAKSLCFPSTTSRIDFVSVSTYPPPHPPPPLPWPSARLYHSRCSPDFYNITGKKPLTYYEYLTSEGAAGDTGGGLYKLNAVV
jgi:hypothetical protein